MHSLRVAIIVLVLLLVKTTTAAPEKPSWSFDCDAPYERCSEFDVPLDWTSGSGRMHLYVEGRFPDSGGAFIVWYVGNHFESTWASLRDVNKVAVVRMYPRGGIRSSPQLTCHGPKAVNGDCFPTPDCAAQLSGTNLSAYSVEAVAEDLDWMLSTLGKGAKNIVVGEGYGAAVAMRWMTKRPNSSTGVMLVNPVHPLRHDVYTSYRGLDQAMNHLMTMCDRDAVCSTRLGAVDGGWAHLQAILSGHKALKCLPHLSAGEDEAATTKSLTHTLARLLTSASMNPLTPSNPELLSLIPSLLYRLERCDSDDVKALQTFRAYMSQRQKCPDSLPLYFSWLVNEFSSPNGLPTPSDLLSADRTRYALTPPERTLAAFHEFYDSLTNKYNSTAHDKLVYTRSKVLTLVTDLDPFFSQGITNTLTNIYSDGNNKYRQPYGSWHLSGSSGLFSCISENVKAYVRNMQWAEEDVCRLPEEQRLNFVSVDTEQYFGINDAWQYSGQPDWSPDGGHDPLPTPAKSLRIPKWVLVGVVCILIAAAAYYGRDLVLQRTYRYERLSDNFYDHVRA